MSVPGGVCFQVVSAPRRGVSASRGYLLHVGGVWFGGGVSGPGGSASWGCLVQGSLVLGGLVLWGSGPGGVSAPGGCLLPGGASAPGGCPLLGVAVSQHALKQTESKTPVKTLPWPNFVAAGNEQFLIGVRMKHNLSI